jgi:hypothetical protein
VGAKPPPPDCISLDFHRDHAHTVERVARWVTITVLALLCVAALGNVFGQRGSETTVTGGGATLELSAPGALRSGLVFQGRFTVVGSRAFERPELFVDRGWFDAITVNSLEPQPQRMRSEDGGLALEFEPLAAGHPLTVYLWLMVNPTTVGRRSQGVEFRNAGRTLARIDRTVTIYP